MTKFLVPDYFTFKVSVAKEQSTKYTKENMSRKYKYCNVFISIFGVFKNDNSNSSAIYQQISDPPTVIFHYRLY